MVVFLKILGCTKSKTRLFVTRKMYGGPIVVILGATGAGKSKLALDIAQRLNGEVISADSMQVYKGLDIVTNKVTPEEQAICKHHVIGFLQPLEEYTIVDFKRHALNAIKDIQSRRKLPIICGGTVYYIESVLWEFLLATNDESSSAGDQLLRSVEDVQKHRKELEAMNSKELYTMLEKVDPKQASRLHPNDTRKVIRSIEVYQQSGQKYSELLKLQTGERRIGGPLLFRNSCLIWVQCDKEVLNERINKRVDKMMESGLLKELEDFHEDYNKKRLQEGLEPDYQRGIFQSIGFKEFHKYLTEENHDDTEREKLLTQSINRMKLSTWQYAKYQIKSLNRRIVNRSESIPVYAVDSTNPNLWNEKALYPSLKLLQHALRWSTWVNGVSESSELFKTKEIFEADKLEALTQTLADIDSFTYRRRVCDVCGQKIFITEEQWEVHMKSKKHKRAMAGQKKRLLRTVGILSEHEKRLKLGHGSSHESDNSDVS